MSKKLACLLTLVAAIAAFPVTTGSALAAGVNCVYPLDLVSANQDLSGCNLSKVTIGDYGLESSNLTGANLNQAVLIGYDALANSNLTGANMNKISITGFGLYGANVSGANMSRATFVNDPTNVHGYCEALWGATGAGVNLQGATISGCATGAFGSFANANLNQTTIGGDPGGDTSGYYGGYQFWGASLPGATLRQAHISGYDAFAGADLSGADLSMSTIDGFGLYAANLTGANLSNATISASEALYVVNLTNANLTGAVVTPGLGILTGATYNNTICPDGTNSNNDGGTCAGHGV
jgi:uncharacterized protein YjbI with pentapeptide repeats